MLAILKIKKGNQKPNLLTEVKDTLDEKNILCEVIENDGCDVLVVAHKDYDFAKGVYSEIVSKKLQF